MEQKTIFEGHRRNIIIWQATNAINGQEKWTKNIDKKMRIDRGKFGRPQSHQCEVYTEHILKHLNEVISGYT